MMMKKWMAVPALVATILMGGVALTNAANEVTVTSENFMSTEHNHTQAFDTVNYHSGFNIDAISDNLK